MTPFFDDGTVTIWCADFRDVPLSELTESATCVVTSPPYNVGLAYDSDAQGDARSDGMRIGAWRTLPRWSWRGR
jgi:hypothetical protein